MRNTLYRCLDGSLGTAHQLARCRRFCTHSHCVEHCNTLSFIGLGQQPPHAEWGAMVGASRNLFLSAWWYVTLPGVAIVITAVSANILGDTLRDLLDPRAA